MSPAVATLVYGVLIAFALLLVRAWKIDRDRGGYVDTFATLWRPPFDKLQHLGGSFGLTLLSVALLGVPLVWAAGLTLLAGIGWEIVCGWFSWRDVVADSAGVALAVLLLVAR